MKKIKKFAWVLILLVVAANTVFAQRRTMEPEEKAKFQTERQKTILSLSDQQLETVEKLNLERARKIEDLRAGVRGDRVKNRQEMIAIQEEYDTQMLAILDESQKAKYTELRENRKARMDSKRTNGRGRNNSPRNRNWN